ncbi:MAG: ABC transporter substrate-binding protein [Nitrospinota bacterium]
MTDLNDKSYHAGGRINRRTFLKVAGVGGVALGAGLPMRWADAATPADTIVVGHISAPQTMDLDAGGTFHPASTDALANLYDALVDYSYKVVSGGVRVPDFDAPMRPRLAESWEVSKDGRRYVFRLKRGTVSQYGNELTSADVVYSIEHAFALKGLNFFSFNVGGIKGPDNVKALDRYTFEVRLPEWNPIFLKTRAQWSAGIYDSAEVKKHVTAKDPWAQKWLTKHSAGFGAYRIESWLSGREMVLVARDDYHLGAPKVKRVVLREIPSSANRMALLQTGDIDMARRLTFKQLDSLRRDPKIKVLNNLSGNQYTWMLLRADIAPYNDRRVRQAIALAIPYKDLVKRVFYGEAVVMKAMVPHSYPEASGEFWKYETDLDKAKALLKSAGVKGLTLRLMYALGQPEVENTAIFIQANLRKIGIRVTLEKVTPSVQQGKKFKKEYVAALENFDTPWLPDIGYAARIFSVSYAVVNFVNFKNKDYDRIYEDAMREEDPASRRNLLRKLQAIFMRELPYIPICITGDPWAMRKNIEGYTWHLENVLQYRDFRKA